MDSEVLLMANEVSSRPSAAWAMDLMRLEPLLHLLQTERGGTIQDVTVFELRAWVKRHLKEALAKEAAGVTVREGAMNATEQLRQIEIEEFGRLPAEPEIFLYQNSEQVYAAHSLEQALEFFRRDLGEDDAAAILPDDPLELMLDTEEIEVFSEEPFEDPRSVEVGKHRHKLKTTVLEWRTNRAIGPWHLGEWLGPS